MNRRFLTFALALGVALGATACDDEFLTTVPPDEISSGTFWATERDFNVAMNAAYDPMIGQELDIMYFDGATEIGYSHADWMRQHEYAMGRQDALSGWSASMWDDLFSGISRANEILMQLEAVGGEVMDADAADLIEGQARFLRGYNYHQLLWMFGEVPIFLTVPTVEEARTVARSSREEIYDQVQADLGAAANLLPVSWPSSEWGRATRGAALAYQARTALYEASWQEHHAGNDARANQLYQTAVTASQAVMDLGVYELYPNFRGLFTYEGEHSDEIIFPYIRVQGQNGWWAWVGFAPSSMGANVDAEPTRELVDRFPMIDGLPIDESPLYDPAPPRITYDGSGTPTVETLGMYANRDPRLYATVLFPGGEFNGVVYNSYPSCESGAPEGYCSPTSDRILLTDYNNTYTGYIAQKFVTPEDQANPWNSGLNMIKMRYADVLLMYAEAKAELGQHTDGTVNDVLNQIRDRAGLPADVDLSGMSQADAIDWIRNERTIELAWEGRHLADIKRWRWAEDVMNGPVHGIDIADGSGNFEPVPGQWIRSFAAPRDYLWPIPASERDLNPNLDQNPGY